MKKILLYIVILFIISSEILAQATVYVFSIDRFINQYTSDFICENLELLNERALGIGSESSSGISIECIIINFNAEGGTFDAIDRIIKTIQSSNIPIVIYVDPEDEMLFSNAFLIPISSSFIAMPAGKSLRPCTDKDRFKLLIDAGKMNDTIKGFLSNISSYSSSNPRSLSCITESFEQNTVLNSDYANTMRIVNVLAGNQNELINKLNGQYVGAANGGKILNTLHSPILKINMDIFPQILEILNEPIVGYVVLILAFYCIMWAIFNEQKLFSILSAIVLFSLAFYIFYFLPVNLEGVGLITTAFIFLAIGGKVKSMGLLQALGAVSLFIGSLLLIDFYQTLGIMIIPFYLIVSIVIFTFLVFILAKSF